MGTSARTMREHLDRITGALQRVSESNWSPAIEDPANDFEVSVNDWREQQALIADIKKLLRPLEEDERAARDAIAASLRTYFGAELKEGVNTYSLSNGRKLKMGHKIDRKIDESMVDVARDAYRKALEDPANWGPEKSFDELLRIKYELAVAPFKKLSTAAATAVSRMIVAKPAAPTLEVD